MPGNMPIAESEVNIVRGMLWPGETVELTVKQRRLRPGGAWITPTTWVVTNKRIIFIERDRWGVRKNFELIPFDKVTGVRLDHGIFSSAIYVRVAGMSTERGKYRRNREEGEIHGLRYRDAVLLADLLNRKVLEKERKEEEKERVLLEKHRVARPGLYTYCGECGRKNNASDLYCRYCGAVLGHMRQK
ncbi:MAG: PH domain-containing protein [Candidatus Micrarchaeota archaeon]|nr:PH domain-containing protein [Candidatus Micrarchaeota archaeon]